MDNIIYYVVPGALAFFVVWILFKTISYQRSSRRSGIVLLIVSYAIIALSLHYFMHYLI